MSIIYKYDECPSFMNEMNVHHIWRMHVLNSGCQSYMYDGCPSYLMYYSHKCPSCERPSWWNQWNVLVGGINQNDMVTFKVHMELMESEVRECRALLLGHWYEIMALYYVKSILTEISASRQDRRVLQKSKIIRIEFLSKWGMLQTSRYV